MTESNPLYELKRLRPPPPVTLVCPHCKCVLALCLIECDDYRFATGHCREHGDVVPINSAVVNGKRAYGV